MTSNKEMKYFSAVTYDNNEYHFAVTPENEIYCYEFGLSIPANTLELKPNFVLRDEGSRSIYSLVEYLKKQNIYNPNGTGTENQLISQYIIDDELFEYLRINHMIIFSTDMAKLYGFDPTHASDAHYQTRAFKSSRYDKNKKARVLAPQKQGKFH